MLARKRVVKKVTGKPAEEFKLSKEEAREEVPEVKVKKPSSKKVTSEPSVILDEILKTDTKKFAIPKSLPTVDFMDKPSKSKRHNKNKTNDRPVIDYANEPVKRFEPAAPKKKPKNEFSKVSNPFPNDHVKNPAKAEAQVKPSKSQDKKPETDGKGSNNLSVFTSDSVDSLKIHAHSIKNLKEVLNFNKLTHVQQKSIPAALEGKDLLIRSPTGKMQIKHLTAKTYSHFRC